MSVASLVHARLPALRALVPARRLGDVDVLSVPVAHLRALLTFLRDDPDVACDHLVDVTVVDEGARERRDGDAPRFLLVVLLTSRAHGSRVRIESGLGDDEPAYPTLVPLWPGALLPERELFDLYGVMPEGHPSPRRLLWPEDTIGHAGRVESAATTTTTTTATNTTAANGKRAVVIERTTTTSTRREAP